MAALLVLGWMWARPASPRAAYAAAAKHVKKQFPSATVFRELTWKDDFYRMEEDGTIQCFFWVRPPGERNFRPLMVPVTIHAIIGSEDIIDAMDLRAFGVGPRTWLEVLHYKTRDRLLIVLGVLILAVSLLFMIWGYGGFWVPPALLRLAGG